MATSHDHCSMASLIVLSISRCMMQPNQRINETLMVELSKVNPRKRSTEGGGLQPRGCDLEISLGTGGDGSKFIPKPSTRASSSVRLQKSLCLRLWRQSGDNQFQNIRKTFVCEIEIETRTAADRFFPFLLTLGSWWPTTPVDDS